MSLFLCLHFLFILLGFPFQIYCIFLFRVGKLRTGIRFLMGIPPFFVIFNVKPYRCIVLLSNSVHNGFVYIKIYILNWPRISTSHFTGSQLGMIPPRYSCSFQSEESVSGPERSNMSRQMVIIIVYGGCHHILFTGNFRRKTLFIR